MWLKELFKTANSTYLALMKIMVPALVIIKFLEEIGATKTLASLLDPVMGIMGLPGETGLVWATCLLANIFAAILVFFSQVDYQSLTVMQTSILASIMLIGHVIIVEGAIAKKAGLSWGYTLFYRIGGAILFGVIINIICTNTGLLQEKAHLDFIPKPTENPTLISWAIEQLYGLFVLYLILAGLVVLIYVMKRTGINDLLERILAPVLYRLGINKRATSLTLIGMTLGLAYGGGLLIQESKKESISKRDVFLSMSLISLCHSLIEDTLLVLLLGPSLWIILPARMLYAFTVVYIINKAGRA